jgi:phosphoserine phosphatase RsbU/P
VRAGHPPAIIYDRAVDRFEELRGMGMVLGFDESNSFTEYEYTGWNGSKVLLLGAGGIWETENPEEETFGMERLRTVIRENSGEAAQEAIDATLDAIRSFRGEKAQEDDVTMIIVKRQYPQ